MYKAKAPFTLFQIALTRAQVAYNTINGVLAMPPFPEGIAIIYQLDPLAKEYPQ